MQHMQRIMALRHVQLGEIPPRAAHRIEAAALELLQDVGLGEGFVDDLPGLVDRPARQVDQPQGPQRQRDAVAELAVLDVDQFERTAAEIAGNAIGIGNAGHDAQGRDSAPPPCRTAR